MQQGPQVSAHPPRSSSCAAGIFLMPVPQECVVEIDIIAFSNICFSGVLTVAGYEICTTFRPCILNANMHQSKVCNLGTLGKIWLCVLACLLVHKVILTQRTPPPLSRFLIPLPSQNVANTCTLPSFRKIGKLALLRRTIY